MARMEVNINYIRRDVDELRSGLHRVEEHIQREAWRYDINALKDTIHSESSKRQEQFTELRGEIGDVRREIGDLRAAMTTETGNLRATMTTETGDLRVAMTTETGDLRVAMTAMEFRLERKFEQCLLKFQSRMLWAIGAAVGPIMLAWFIQTFLPALRASGV